MAYTIEYYKKHNQRLSAEIRDLKAREGELLKENRELNDRLLQEQREVKLMQAKNRQIRERLKLANVAIQLGDKDDGN